MTAQVFTWDWKEQAPWEQISAAVNALALLGRPAWLTGVTETGGDSCAVVVSDLKLTEAEATQLYCTPDALVQVEVAIEYPTGNTLDVIDIPLAELIGLEGQAREDKITELAEDHFNNVCSWGAVETGTTDYPEDA